MSVLELSIQIFLTSRWRLKVWLTTMAAPIILQFRRFYFFPVEFVAFNAGSKTIFEWSHMFAETFFVNHCGFKFYPINYFNRILIKNLIGQKNVYRKLQVSGWNRGLDRSEACRSSLVKKLQFFKTR